MSPVVFQGTQPRKTISRTNAFISSIINSRHIRPSHFRLQGLNSFPLTTTGSSYLLIYLSSDGYILTVSSDHLDPFGDIDLLTATYHSAGLP